MKRSVMVQISKTNEKKCYGLNFKKKEVFVELIYVIQNLLQLGKGCWNFIRGLSDLCMDDNIMC